MKKSITGFVSPYVAFPFVIAVLLFCLSFWIGSFSQRLLEMLENRFPIWADECNSRIAGIIVLGGSFNGVAAPGERMLAAIALSKKYPNARLMYSGKEEAPGIAAEDAAQTFENAGIERDRILTEGLSRNTAENGEFSAKVASPRKSERWILVTSAFHMPRAIAAFRNAGFNVEAYPVEFSRNSKRPLRTSVKEFAGLGWYWLTGRSQELFPAPRHEVCLVTKAN